MLKQLGQQEKQFLQFSEHAKNEIDAVTSKSWYQIFKKHGYLPDFSNDYREL